MSKAQFTDITAKPDEQLLFSAIGENHVYWKELMHYLNETCKNVSLEWKYYKDAKCWLMPVSVRNKNLAWISVAEGTFRVGFWFGNKAGSLLEKSNLPEEIKEKYQNATQNKMGRGIAIFVYNKTDLDSIIQLLEFKQTLK